MPPPSIMKIANFIQKTHSLQYDGYTVHLFRLNNAYFHTKNNGDTPLFFYPSKTGMERVWFAG